MVVESMNGGKFGSLYLHLRLVSRNVNLDQRHGILQFLD